MKKFIPLVLLLSGFYLEKAHAATSYSAPVSVTATTTSTLELAPNAFRTYLLIINTGSNTVIAKAGSVQSANEGIPIPAGGNYEPILAPANGIWMKTTSATSAVTLIEGVEK